MYAFSSAVKRNRKAARNIINIRTEMKRGSEKKMIITLEA
jgi:hypothetical protein